MSRTLEELKPCLNYPILQASGAADSEKAMQQLQQSLGNWQTGFTRKYA